VCPWLLQPSACFLLVSFLCSSRSGAVALSLAPFSIQPSARNGELRFSISLRQKPTRIRDIFTIGTTLVVGLLFCWPGLLLFAISSSGDQQKRRTLVDLEIVIAKTAYGDYDAQTEIRACEESFHLPWREALLRKIRYRQESASQSSHHQQHLWEVPKWHQRSARELQDRSSSGGTCQ